MPSLRDVEKTAPYMHTGEFDTLEEVLSFYNTMPGTVRMGHRELFLRPLHLKPRELEDLKSFLVALSSEPADTPGISRWSRCSGGFARLRSLRSPWSPWVGLVLSWLLAGRPLACHERAEASL